LSSRIPKTLTLLTISLAAIAAIPTTLLGGVDAASMMALGAGLSLAIVLGGYFSVRFLLRGPSRFAAGLMVAGFVARFAFFFLAVAFLVATTDLEPGRFILWMIGFYFILVMAEAAIVARSGEDLGQGVSR
jgi:hypothetical protein